MDKPAPQPPQWERVREILHQALDRDPAERPAFLDQACAGDAPLRSELDSLIAASNQTARWLDKPAVALTVAAEAAAPQQTAHLEPGTIVSHYRIIGKLGEGGMGAVYHAVDTLLDRPVALKVLAHVARDPTEGRRLVREAQAASALNHPNIVTIYEYGTAGGAGFLAMEYVRGATLEALLAGNPRPPLQVWLGYARQIATGLAKAHAAGIVHRDLKPGNVMVTEDGVIKILDFGLARHEVPAETGAATMVALTRQGAILGTPAYMSPEQALGERVDQRSDVFSFGVMLYEIVTGKRPFQGANVYSTLHEVTARQPVPVLELQPETPPRLATLITRCLEKDKDQRLRSMQDAIAAFDLLLAPPPAVPVASSSRRTAVASVIAAALGVSAGTIYYTTRPAPAVPLRLSYALEVQRMREGQPEGLPYRPVGDEVFQAGWKFRLYLQTHQPGHLYLFSDGPGPDGTPVLFLLRPAPGAASQQAPLAEPAPTGWFVFDEHPGVERLWIVWSGQSVAVLERAVVNSAPTKGLLPAQMAEPVRDALARLQMQAEMQSSRSAGLTSIRTAAPHLAELLLLRHR
jgi:predicted Ser/Thr protein kinase